MKKMLVVGDHYELLSFFYDLMTKLELYKRVFIEIFYSAGNKNPLRFENLTKGCIDFRVSEHVQYARSFQLLLSIHCKQIVPKEIVESVKCFNLHPGFNPYGRGWYPHIFSIIEKRPVGATLHIMDTEIDHGPIIDRLEVPVYSDDTSLEVYERILEVEKKLLEKNLLKIIEGRESFFQPEEEGVVRTIKDFKKLCKLDLKSVDTFESHLNILRALSHGDFFNAYYTDQNDIIRVKVVLKKEKSSQ